jgi:putative SOS response-associated peptidase YedK
VERGATAQVTAVGWDREAARRVIVPMTWGLLASREKHPDAAKMKPINARCETVATSRMFAPAFRQRRVLVAVDAWYEWTVEGAQKNPHALGHSDGLPVVLGGIWECCAVRSAIESSRSPS